MQDPVMQWVTLAIAVYGAVLGSLGFWHSQRRDKPKIALTPEILKTATGKHRLMFRISNRGLIDAQITEVGFAYKLRTHRIVFRPSFIQNIGTPIKLAAGEEVIVYVPAPVIEHISTLRMRYACITTGHGKTIKARSGALTYLLHNPLEFATDQEIERALQGPGVVSSKRGVPKSKLMVDKPPSPS